MVHYIRFLKPPKLELQVNGSFTVKALVTVTTDLGDTYLHADTDFYAILITKCAEENVSAWQTFRWKKDMRVLWLEIGPLVGNLLKLPHKMLVSPYKTKVPKQASLHHLPEILSAWSESFSLDCPSAGNKVERRFVMSEEVVVRVWEDTAESIARHIWDAGIALSTYLNDLLLYPQILDLKPMFPKALKNLIHEGKSLRAIELGSGCGIVGLQLAHALPDCHVLVTDLPEAMEVLDYNISQAEGRLASNSRIKSATLDWEGDLGEMILKNQTLQPPASHATSMAREDRQPAEDLGSASETPALHFDLILVSDCTYNSDSIPALVKTLTALIKRSPAALVVVSMKVRHDSEAMFHQLIAEFGFVEEGHSAIKMPDKSRADIEQALEVVDIYVYCSAISC